MQFQFLPPTVHGALDYLAASALIVMPVILGLTGVAFWMSVAGGAGLVLYSLLTDYRFGIVRVLSFDLHLALDLAAGAAFIVAPFALAFDAFTSIYYFVMGAGVIAVVALSSRRSAVTA